LSIVAGLLASLDEVTKAMRSVSTAQLNSATVKDAIHRLATRYFSEVEPQLVQAGIEAEDLSAEFRTLHAMSRVRPTTQRCRDVLREARKSLVVIEGVVISRPPKIEPTATNPVDDLIVSSLNDICPTAAAAYQQALVDFRAPSRFSWRGPATDLREALRETLDTLAPDTDVTAGVGFKLEQDAKRPTMKQKVRFVLRGRGVPSGAMETPETAVQGIEEFIGGLTRSVYTRSSVSTHTASSREEAARVHAWVRLVLCELLEIPL
jgi:Predicted pPIWI-associating nuclease